MKPAVLPILGLLIAGFVAACDDRPPPGDKVSLHERSIEGSEGSSVSAEIWVDNWFSMAINGEPLIEDSVAYKTERSFNAERVTFSAEFPMTVAIELRDFIENDTGLEYIGSNRQQIGDGGAIAQFIDLDTGEVIGVTNGIWKCQVIHQAPANADCADEDDPTVGKGSCAASITEMPDGWMAPDFDDSAWVNATEHSSSAVSPKGGYDEIDWDAAAKLIWSEDLELDNVVLCRTTIQKP